MIQEMPRAYKEKMSSENYTYRICWKLYDELTDIFCNEDLISEDFKTYFLQLKEQRERQYRRHFSWGYAMECGIAADEKSGGNLDEEIRRAAVAKKRMEQIMKSHSEEMFALWRLFCCVESYCRTQEAAYMCVQGIEKGEAEKNSLHPI